MFIAQHLTGNNELKYLGLCFVPNDNISFELGKLVILIQNLHRSKPEIVSKLFLRLNKSNATPDSRNYNNYGWIFKKEFEHLICCVITARLNGVSLRFAATL